MGRDGTQERGDEVEKGDENEEKQRARVERYDDRSGVILHIYCQVAPASAFDTIKLAWIKCGRRNGMQGKRA